MTGGYDLSGILPEATPEELSAGTNVLISSPSMLGKRRLAMRMLAAGHEDGDGILLVTTKDNATAAIEDLESQVPSLDPDRIGLIDCSGTEAQRQLQRIATEQVTSPADLTGISIGMAKLMDRFSDQSVTSVRHGLVSISTLLQYLDAETVFKFLHIYTTRVRDSDGIAIFTIHSDMHDEQTINTMSGEFDGVIRLREGEAGTVEYSVRGFGRPPSGWFQLEF